MNKNIGIVISGLKRGGGAEKTATIVGNQLYKEGYNVKYLTFYKYENKYDFLGEEICLDEKIGSNILVNFYKLFKRAYKIESFCQENNIDTCLSFMEEANFPNIISKNLFHNLSSTVISVRNSIENSNSKSYKKLIRILYPKADYIVPIVREEVQNLVDNYGIESDKISNVYNAFDIEKIDKKKKENLEDYEDLMKNDKYTFINVGRLDEQKNQKMLLRAFDKFHQNHPQSQLVILGDGELKEELYSQKNILQSGKDIHFLGLQNNPFKFMYRSDCFVLSSQWEGMPRVLMEALACGLPAISTDCKTGPKEILRKNCQNFEEVNQVRQEEYGMLVPTDDVDKMYEAMKKMYNNKDLQKKYSERARQRAKDFKVNEIVKEWINVL